MKRFKNISAFQTFLRDQATGRIAEGKVAGLRAAARIISTEIKGEIGHKQTGDAGFDDWPDLAPGTLEGWDTPQGRLEGKIERGFAPPENPLLATGAMRDSIGERFGEDSASIGTDDPVAIYQNEGTEKRGVPFQTGETTTPGIPARNFVGRAGFRSAPDAVEAIGAAVVGALTK